MHLYEDRKGYEIWYDEKSHRYICPKLSIIHWDLDYIHQMIDTGTYHFPPLGPKDNVR